MKFSTDPVAIVVLYILFQIGNMKRVAMTVIILNTCLLSYSQRNNEFFFWPVNPSTEKIEFAEVVYVQANAKTLYNRASAFVAKTFVSERDSILEQDESKHTITARGSYVANVEALGERGKGFVTFALTIRCNEHSYNYSLTNFEHFPAKTNSVTGGRLEREVPLAGGYIFPTKYWYQLKAKCFYNVQMTVERIKEAMDKKTES